MATDGPGPPTGLSGAGRPRSNNVALVAGVVVAAAALALGGLLIANMAIGPRPETPPFSAPSARLHISSMSAQPVSPVHVELRWTAATGPVASYLVYRNGTLLTTQPGAATQLSDSGAQPDQMYTYGVEAVDAWGHHSDRVSATASTPPPPPVDQARLEGDFAVKATFVSENYQNFSVGQVEKLTFSFTPQCADGPCQVRVDLFAPHESLSMLAKHGARYEGALTALTDKCGSTELPSHLDIDVWVTKASYIQGAWRATAFGGMLGHSSSAKRGCQAGISRQTLAGTLQK